ncbi:tetraspanin-2-like [Nicotiana sylvestris]|uniref:Tetraspanin-2-like n=1 Tax=Nicotiana sylvestris TaxID=4096 RepID=A0A1U7XJT3_NICSY|nr:PREDICTED: tetraspanin-2-like [Nicotiana sylvestris]
MDLGKYGYIIMLILNLFGIIISIPIIVIPLVTVDKFCRETSMTMFLIAGIMILTWSFAGLISSLCCWKIGFQEFIYMRSQVFILFIVVLLGTMAWWQSRTDSRLYTYYDWETFKNCMVKKQVCQRNLRNGLERLSPFASHSLQDACCKYPQICDDRNMSNKESKNQHGPLTWMEIYDGLPATDNNQQGEKQNKSNNETDGDCGKWSSDSNKLCFDCNACKKGYLDKQDQNWVAALSISVVNSVVLLSFSCYFYSKNFGEPNRGNTKSSKVHPADV